MKPFRDLAIKTKLQRVISLTTVLALGIACSSIIAYQWFNYRRTAVQELKGQAELIANTSMAALAFHDATAAREYLGALRSTPAVIGAWLYTPDGQLFADYTAEGRKVEPLPVQIEEDHSWFEGSQLMLMRVIRLKGELVGKLELRADMHDEQRYLLYSIGIEVGCMILAAAVSLGFARRLQQSILDPILGLSKVAGQVAKDRDYRVRATRESRDEVGDLTDAFNDMLEQIENRDKQLRATNEQLDLTANQLRSSEHQFRQLTENIREVFWLTNADNTQMLYISPAYESVWGRSCASLVREPSSWVDAVHPADRERVAQARRRLAASTYDVEYRVVQPDGAVRWVRDRAFPIRDGQGELYRIAGIAEDITERRQAENSLRLQAQITGSMDEGVVLTRAQDATILYANPKFERMFGYEAGEMSGKPVEIVNAGEPERARQVAAEIIIGLKAEGSWSGEIQNRRKDGTAFWSSANISTFEHPDHGKLWVSVHSDITSRKQALEQLQAAEAKYRLLVERVPAITYTSEVGAEGRWYFVSPQIEQLLGFKPAEWVENPRLWLRQVHPDDRAKALASEENCQEGGRYSCEYRVRTREGLVIWVLDEGSFIGQENGRLLIQGVIQDIDARKKSEERVRESEERYRQLVEYAPDAIGVVVEGRITFINAAGVRMLRGRDVRDLVGRGVAEFIHPATRQRTMVRMRGVLKTGAPAVLAEAHLRRTDGSGFFADVTAIRVPFQHKLAVQFILRDITQRKESEAALREMRERLQNIYESSRDAIVYVGLDGRLIDFNRVYEEMTGYTAEELRRMTYQELTPSEYHEMEQRTVEQIVRTGQAAQFEKEYRRKDGRRVPVALNAFVVLGTNGKARAMAAVVRDISEQRRLQQQILEVSDREQRRIGHDLHDGLCQLLIGISFAMKALEERLSATNQPAAKNAHDIVDLVREANEEARNVARGLHPVGVEAGGLVMALQELAFNAENLYNVRCELQCDSEFVMPDHARAIHAYRIVQEAVNNALKHARAQEIVIRLSQANGMVTVQVRDDGAGLPEPGRDGRGMGMHIMAYRARMIGGTLDVRRGSPKGTLVQLVFAISQANIENT